MEGKSSESNLDNFYEYEQRSRAHTWPEQNFQQLHPISTDLISRTSSLASVFYTNVYSPMTVEHISNLIPRYDSGVKGKKNEVKKEASTSTVIIEGTECHPEDPLQDETRKRSKRCAASGLKKANAWGEGSYSQLITQALNCAPNGRLKLSEIYTWFMCNIPYFGARSTPQLSSAWKNSIRHNLSLHNRFMRVQNEGAGKSSWWMINPDAKPGRNPRRQRSATLESTTKVAIDKKRRGARKKAMEIRARAVNSSLLHSGNNSIVSSQVIVILIIISYFFFSSRTQSNLSLPASTSRVSPSMMENYENFDSFDFPPFVEATGGMPHDILDRTNEVRIYDNENNVQPPPSYHELNVVRSVQNIQNPLLRTHLIQSRMPGHYSPSSGDVGVSSWMHSNMIPITIHPSISCSAQQPFSGNGSALPIDLENLALPDQPLMEVENMEAVLRHELSQSTGSQLSFDNI
ncbi:unnamed protein product [Thelazia callipaeda]|uniref:Forkhead box protein O n=1 Tax=Thelazia callipaeda TaxID=103827 RepID=A0A0N5CQJ0_THECL|nr:unnamed protein product [Thelazia callipaeda]